MKYNLEFYLESNKTAANMVYKTQPLSDRAKDLCSFTKIEDLPIFEQRLN